MEHFQQYMARQRSVIDTLQKELTILEAVGLDLFVTNNNHGRREFETRDYPLADKVEIELYSTYGVDYSLIQFTHDARTPHGDMMVYCRHEGWDGDGKRYAQANSIELPYNTRRQDIQVLLKFYQEQGVKQGLLNDLRQKIEQLYLQPIPEELDLELDKTKI